MEYTIKIRESLEQKLRDLYQQEVEEGFAENITFETFLSDLINCTLEQTVCD